MGHFMTKTVEKSQNIEKSLNFDPYLGSRSSWPSLFQDPHTLGIIIAQIHQKCPQPTQSTVHLKPIYQKIKSLSLPPTQSHSNPIQKKFSRLHIRDSQSQYKIMNKPDNDFDWIENKIQLIQCNAFSEMKRIELKLRLRLIE